ncbi:uncharacterized protein [Argopecten irradians]|uniref:uncharacterized protein isoform X3 n=1 Tax=Argopecten irradians TaxID=31199 RepID=UPI003720ACC2
MSRSEEHSKALNDLAQHTGDSTNDRLERLKKIEKLRIQGYQKLRSLTGEKSGTPLSPTRRSYSNFSPESSPSLYGSLGRIDQLGGVKPKSYSSKSLQTESQSTRSSLSEDEGDDDRPKHLLRSRSATTVSDAALTAAEFEPTEQIMSYQTGNIDEHYKEGDDSYNEDDDNIEDFKRSLFGDVGRYGNKTSPRTDGTLKSFSLSRAWSSGGADYEDPSGDGGDSGIDTSMFPSYSSDFLGMNYGETFENPNSYGTTIRKSFSRDRSRQPLLRSFSSHQEPVNYADPSVSRLDSGYDRTYTRGTDRVSPEERQKRIDSALDNIFSSSRGSNESTSVLSNRSAYERGGSSRVMSNTTPRYSDRYTPGRDSYRTREQPYTQRSFSSTDYTRNDPSALSSSLPTERKKIGLSEEAERRLDELFNTSVTTTNRPSFTSSRSSRSVKTEMPSIRNRSDQIIINRRKTEDPNVRKVKPSGSIIDRSRDQSFIVPDVLSTNVQDYEFYGSEQSNIRKNSVKSELDQKLDTLFGAPDVQSTNVMENDRYETTTENYDFGYSEFTENPSTTVSDQIPLDQRLDSLFGGSNNTNSGSYVSNRQPLINREKPTLTSMLYGSENTGVESAETTTNGRPRRERKINIDVPEIRRNRNRGARQQSSTSGEDSVDSSSVQPSTAITTVIPDLVTESVGMVTPENEDMVIVENFEFLDQEHGEMEKMPDVEVSLEDKWTKESGVIEENIVHSENVESSELEGRERLKSDLLHGTHNVDISLQNNEQPDQSPESDKTVQETGTIQKDETKVKGQQKTNITQKGETKVKSQHKTDQIQKSETKVKVQQKMDKTQKGETKVKCQQKMDNIQKGEINVKGQNKTDKTQKGETKVKGQQKTDTIQKGETLVTELQQSVKGKQLDSKNKKKSKSKKSKGKKGQKESIEKVAEKDIAKINPKPVLETDIDWPLEQDQTTVDDFQDCETKGNSNSPLEDKSVESSEALNNNFGFENKEESYTQAVDETGNDVQEEKEEYEIPSETSVDNTPTEEINIESNFTAVIETNVGSQEPKSPEKTSWFRSKFNSLLHGFSSESNEASQKSETQNDEQPKSETGESVSEKQVVPASNGVTFSDTGTASEDDFATASDDSTTIHDDQNNALKYRQSVLDANIKNETKTCETLDGNDTVDIFSELAATTGMSLDIGEQSPDDMEGRVVYQLEEELLRCEKDDMPEQMLELEEQEVEIDQQEVYMQSEEISVYPTEEFIEIKEMDFKNEENNNESMKFRQMRDVISKVDNSAQKDFIGTTEISIQTDAEAWLTVDKASAHVQTMPLKFDKWTQTDTLLTPDSKEFGIQTIPTTADHSAQYDVSVKEIGAQVEHKHGRDLVKEGISVHNEEGQNTMKQMKSEQLSLTQTAFQSVSKVDPVRIVKDKITQEIAVTEEVKLRHHSSDEVKLEQSSSEQTNPNHLSSEQVDGSVSKVDAIIVVADKLTPEYAVVEEVKLKVMTPELTNPNHVSTKQVDESVSKVDTVVILTDKITPEYAVAEEVKLELVAPEQVKLGGQQKSSTYCDTAKESKEDRDTNHSMDGLVKSTDQENTQDQTNTSKSTSSWSNITGTSDISFSSQSVGKKVPPQTLPKRRTKHGSNRPSSRPSSIVAEGDGYDFHASGQSAASLDSSVFNFNKILPKADTQNSEIPSDRGRGSVAAKAIDTTGPLSPGKIPVGSSCTLLTTTVGPQSPKALEHSMDTKDSSSTTSSTVTSPRSSFSGMASLGSHSNKGHAKSPPPALLPKRKATTQLQMPTSPKSPTSPWSAEKPELMQEYDPVFAKQMKMNNGKQEVVKDRLNRLKDNPFIRKDGNVKVGKQESFSKKCEISVSSKPRILSSSLTPKSPKDERKEQMTDVMAKDDVSDKKDTSHGKSAGPKGETVDLSALDSRSLRSEIIRQSTSRTSMRNVAKKTKNVDNIKSKLETSEKKESSSIVNKIISDAAKFEAKFSSGSSPTEKENTVSETVSGNVPLERENPFIQIPGVQCPGKVSSELNSGKEDSAYVETSFDDEDEVTTSTVIPTAKLDQSAQLSVVTDTGKQEAKLPTGQETQSPTVIHTDPVQENKLEPPQRKRKLKVQVPPPEKLEEGQRSVPDSPSLASQVSSKLEEIGVEEIDGLTAKPDNLQDTSTTGEMKINVKLDQQKAAKPPSPKTGKPPSPKTTKSPPPRHNRPLSPKVGKSPMSPRGCKSPSPKLSVPSSPRGRKSPSGSTPPSPGGKPSSPRKGQSVLSKAMFGDRESGKPASETSGDSRRSSEFSGSNSSRASSVSSEGSSPPDKVEANYDMYISPEEQKGVVLDEDDDDDEVVPSRINMREWNPTKLLCDIYMVKLAKEEVEDVSDKFIGMEGLMEKLPMNKKKSTLLKTWKRRFFRAKDGWLHYFEPHNHDKPSDSVQLMGGRIDDLGNRILGIDDGRGRYLMVRCPTDKEYGQWKLALESQTVDNVRATYVRPVLKSPPNPKRKVVLIDIGSCSIRAGILGEQACLPELFFPSTVARRKDSSEIHIGIQAYHPDVRKTSTLMKAVRPTNKMDKSENVVFNVDTEVMPAVLKKIFTDLNVDSTEYWIMMSTPQNLADQLKAALFEILIGQFRVKGVCMVMQSLLALYSYQKTSGILVDIGQRMEILPICDGYVIEGGVSRQSYGGQKVEDCLHSSLTENKYVFGTPVEQLILRHIMEQSCYVAEDYSEMEKKCAEDPESCQSTVFLDKYDLPEGAHRQVIHNRSCYHSPEGFFHTDLWGMDYPCVHNLVFKAIQYCPIDSRKQMYRAIYLSGGVTMLPGFAERLQKELVKLAPPSVIVEVHASPQRYHAAYIGACSLANMDMFEQSCITGDEWARNGVKAFAKWAMQSS